MPTSVEYRCGVCDAPYASFALFDVGEAGPTQSFMFAEPLADTSAARLSYETSEAVGVRILEGDDVAEVQAALRAGAPAVAGVLPELMPSTCPNGHPQP